MFSWTCLSSIFYKLNFPQNEGKIASTAQTEEKNLLHRVYKVLLCLEYLRCNICKGYYSLRTVVLTQVALLLSATERCGHKIKTKLHTFIKTVIVDKKLLHPSQRTLHFHWPFLFIKKLSFIKEQKTKWNKNRSWRISRVFFRNYCQTLKLMSKVHRDTRHPFQIHFLCFDHKIFWRC